MQLLNNRRHLWLVLIVIVTVAIFGYVLREGSGSTVLFALEPPAFTTSTNSYVPPEIATRLDEEAGISAYYNTPGSIDLNSIRGQFRTIELDTTDYLLGSIPVRAMNERYDVHVYVHKDGWILGYYMNDEPVAKIVDAGQKTIDTTRLTVVISAVAA